MTTATKVVHVHHHHGPESLPEWQARQSKEGPLIFDAQTNQELYASGAIRSEMGLIEPPTDNGSLLRQQRRYWTTRLRDEVDAFNRARTNEYSQAITAANNAAIDGSVPCPGMETVEQLKAGRERIIKLVEKLKGLEALIHDLPENVAARRQQQIINERAQRAKQIAAAIQAVTLDGIMEGASAS